VANLPENAGVDFRVEDHIYTFSEVVFFIDDPNGEVLYYPVAGITIDNRLNTIPSAALVIAPQSFPAAEAINQETAQFIFVSQPEPIRPTLLDFVGEYRKLQKLMLTDGIKATLLVTVERSDGNETQRVVMADWIPTEVTINSSSQSGSFLLNVVIQHPSYLSASASGWLPNSADTLNPPEQFLTNDDGLGPNLVGLFIDAVKTYLLKAEAAIYNPETAPPATTTSNIECAADIETLSEAVLDRLEVAIEAFNETLEWNALGGNDLPLEDDLSDAGVDEVNFFGRLLWQLAGRQDSPWMTFVSLLNEYDLVVSGAPTSEKLIVTPFVPWGKYSMRLFDGECVSINMPGMGQRDVSGVLSAYAAGGQNDWGGPTTYTALEGQGTVSNPAQFNTLGGYVCPLLEEPKLLGAVAYRDPPSWLSEYLYDQSGDFGENGANNPMGRDEANYDSASVYEDDTAAKGEGSSTEDRADNYSGMVSKWSRQAFFRLYKSDNNFSVNTRLLITSPSADTPGNYVRPGIVLRISSITFPNDIPSPGLAEETPVLYFYVTRVIHNILPGQQEAGTTIAGTYLRFADEIDQAGVTADNVENGIENPLYNSLGSFSEAAVEGSSGGSDTIPAGGGSSDVLTG
jgi:hypothetical protein